MHRLQVGRLLLKPQTNIWGSTEQWRYVQGDTSDHKNVEQCGIGRNCGPFRHPKRSSKGIRGNCVTCGRSTAAVHLYVAQHLLGPLALEWQCDGSLASIRVHYSQHCPLLPWLDPAQRVHQLNRLRVVQQRVPDGRQRKLQQPATQIYLLNFLEVEWPFTDYKSFY